MPTSRARILKTALVLAVAALWTAAGADAQTKLLRFPDIHGDRIVFTYAGDLWTVPATGGDAVRLTAHPGKEVFGKFSPDGETIAFTGQYDGDEQVYVVPAEGGIPTQLTYYPAQGPLAPRWGYDNMVYGWSPDGSGILIRSLRDSWKGADGQLYLVPVEGGLPETLPMPVAGAGAFSPDGRKVVYSPLWRDFRSWKRYEGGWAQDLWIFDLDSLEAEQITFHPRTERDPMWIGDRIYFTADWDGTLNLYAFDLGRREPEQLTHSRDWDVRWPSADPPAGKIVYELGGELHVFDTASGRSRHVPIRVPDDGLWKRPARVSAAGQIFDFSLSPKGERVLFAARGDIFSAPIEKGPTRNLTRASGSHDKWPRWSPDGRQVAFVSDRTGEEELYLVAQDGRGEPQQLTTGGAAMRYAPAWASDGERLAFSDKDGGLFVLTVADKGLAQIAHEERGQVQDYAWSPCGGHLAFSLSDVTNFRSIYIWSAGDGQVRRVTGEMASEWSPAWDPSGKYLYYLSGREHAPQISNVEWNFAGNRSTGIFALALRKDVPHPFAPESDEVTIEEDGEEKEDEKDEKKVVTRIDFDGLADRVARVPVEHDNIFGISSNEGHLLYVKTGAFFYGRQSYAQPTLHVFAHKDRKESTLAENIQGYALSQDGAKVLVQQQGQYHLLDAKPGGEKEKKTVSTAGLQVDRVPTEEWEQIFDEVWRRFRDFFYVENLHGYDWEGLRRQYRPLLDHVAHRSDLNYVIGEMIAELNVSHAYIAGGDFDIPERPQVALLGARLELDREANRYRIARIFRGENDEDRYRSPLTEIGVDARVGDYVLAINGDELTGDMNPYKLLRHRADLPVELLLNRRPTPQGARTVTVRPLTSETSLIYLDWVARNREKVAEATGGRVGYLHIPDMGADGIREFIKWFYPQIRKEGLVIDVRHNGGGNVSQMLIERLRRELLATGFARTSETASTYPAQVFHGHMASILNENSASDGDIFPAMFRQAGLGPLIGKRSWGGVIGITGRGPLVDGGSVFVPEFGFASPDGEWIIENYGVDPDIEVDNDPRSVIEGRDPQLERAIEEVVEAIAADPKRLPERPADPVRVD